MPAKGREASARGPAFLVAAFAVGVGFAWRWFARDGGHASGAGSKTTVTIPADQTLESASGSRPLAVAPDGRRIAYAASKDGITRLYVRALDSFEPAVLPGTEGARFPFFSPDGESITFFANGVLKRVAIAAGAPIPICEPPAARPGGRGRGGTWGPDGTIVFDPGDAGLLRVAASPRPWPAATNPWTRGTSHGPSSRRTDGVFSPP